MRLFASIGCQFGSAWNHTQLAESCWSLLRSRSIGFAIEFREQERKKKNDCQYVSDVRVCLCVCLSNSITPRSISLVCISANIRKNSREKKKHEINEQARPQSLSPVSLHGSSHTNTRTMPRLWRIAYCKNTAYSEAINLLLIFSTFPIQYSPLSTWIRTDGKVYMCRTTTANERRKRKKEKLSKIVAYQKCYVGIPEFGVSASAQTHTHSHT